LGLIARLFLEPGEAVVTSHGAYPTFQYHVVAYGGRLITVPYGPDYRNDLAALVETAKDVNAKMLYLANPDNPTGTVHSFADIQDAMFDLPEDCLLLLDEAYIEFASDCALSLDAEIDPRIIRFRTFSKVHGMAGARVGYVLANDAVVAALDKVRNHFGLNRVSQAGALASLGDASFLQHVVAETAHGRDEYAALATKYGLKPIPSSTNFVLIDVGDSDRAAHLVGQLANHGVFIRMPGVSPLNRCIRVTVGTSEQRAVFADVFSRCVEA
jgi:histidinol-phosphate aminotransferase